MMVKIKGTEISNKIARDSIKLMEKLIYLYENPKEYFSCPLCDLPATLDYCENCPWRLIKSTFCGSNNFFTVIREDPRRKRNRIRQLGRWIKIYQKALDIK